jgi:dipeptidyl aminopeptidase/acylaminoacyl peptidase
VVTACGHANEREGYTRVWDAQTGKPLTEPLRHEGYVRYAQFSPDGRRVVTGSDDKTARVWDVQTGKPLTEALRHEDGVQSAQFSPDGLRVVTASTNTARVWDAQTGKPLTEPLQPNARVHFAQFSPDGLRVLTASGNGARVWDAQTGQPLTEALRHEYSVHSARFSPNGLRVVTASDDNTARIWEMPLGSMPAPSWLAELAVSVAGQRLSGAAVLEPVEAESFLKLKEQLNVSPGTNFYSRWAKWFCADRATRTISPLSSITVPEYIQRRIEENTFDSLQEAVRLSPTNGLAFARLAKLVLAQRDADNPRRVGEADFFSRHAVKLAPRDSEVAKIRAEIEERIKNLPKP